MEHFQFQRWKKSTFLFEYGGFLDLDHGFLTRDSEIVPGTCVEATEAKGL